MVVSRAAVCSLSRSMFFAESLDPAAHRLRSTLLDVVLVLP
jgi:hypothetical protein